MTDEKHGAPPLDADEREALDLGLSVFRLLRTASSPLVATSAFSISMAALAQELDRDPVEFATDALEVVREAQAAMKSKRRS